MTDFFLGMYLESHFSKQYQLEMEILSVKQGAMTIQECDNQMTSFGDQLALMEPQDLETLESYVPYREKNGWFSFLWPLSLF